MAGFIVLMAPASIRGSSNGRTPGFGPGYRGSNPCPRARYQLRSTASLPVPGKPKNTSKTKVFFLWHFLCKKIL